MKWEGHARFRSDVRDGRAGAAPNAEFSHLHMGVPKCSCKSPGTSQRAACKLIKGVCVRPIAGSSRSLVAKELKIVGEAQRAREDVEPRDGLKQQLKDAVSGSEALFEAAGKLLEMVKAAKAARAKAQAAGCAAEDAQQTPVQEASASSEKASREDATKESQEFEKAEEDPAVKATAVRCKPC